MGWYILSFGNILNYGVKDAYMLYQMLKFQTSQKAQIIRISGLSDSVVPLLSANAVAVYTRVENLETLKNLTGALRYRKAGYVELISPEFSTLSTGSWALDKIMADSCWVNGYNGSGVLVVIMDSGIDTSHPYLINKWSGLWYDAVEGSERPTDSPILPHGTIVAGVLVGDSTGVAPGAKIAVVRIFGTYLTSNEVSTHLGFSKILEWKIDSGYNIRVYNGSWKTGDTSGSLEYWNDIMLLRMAGIIPVFALGNTWYGNFSPGNYPLVIGVGATNMGDTLAGFSSRGPAPNKNPWNDPTYWPFPTWNLLKPDVVAPGVSVLTTDIGGGFRTASGTSLSSPITAGIVALMLQKNPSLTFQDVYRILTSSTDTFPWGSPYPNNLYGFGRVNAWKAVRNTPPPSTILPVVLSWRIKDGTFDGLDSLIITLKNYTSNSSTALFSLSTNDSRVSINTPPFTFLVPANDTFSLTFEIYGSGITDGEYIPFTLKAHFSDSTINQILVPFGRTPKDFVSIDTTALKISFTRTGKLFKLLYNGISNLYLASFAFGMDHNRVSDAWVGILGNDRDFYPTDTFKILPFVPQGYYITQADTFGLSYTLLGYGYGGDSFLNFSFTVKNTTPFTISGYLGFFADLDVGRPSRDTGFLFSSLRCALMGAVDGSFTGYIGIQALSPTANISFIRNSLWFPISDSVKFSFLRGDLTFSPDTISDWSVMLSSGPYTLNPGDSATFHIRLFYSTTPNCPVLTFSEENMVKLGSSKVEIYDISGRRVSKVKKKGVYFVREGRGFRKVILR
jgi:subtilisin family serine protease